MTPFEELYADPERCVRQYYYDFAISKSLGELYSSQDKMIAPVCSMFARNTAKNKFRLEGRTLSEVSPSQAKMAYISLGKKEVKNPDFLKIQPGVNYFFSEKIVGCSLLIFKTKNGSYHSLHLQPPELDDTFPKDHIFMLDYQPPSNSIKNDLQKFFGYKKTSDTDFIIRYNAKKNEQMRQQLLELSRYIPIESYLLLNSHLVFPIQNVQLFVFGILKYNQWNFYLQKQELSEGGESTILGYKLPWQPFSPQRGFIPFQI